MHEDLDVCLPDAVAFHLARVHHCEHDYGVHDEWAVQYGSKKMKNTIYQSNDKNHKKCQCH